MTKDFTVPSSSSNKEYTVSFSDESGAPKLRCNCDAGTFGTLCKHVLSVIDKDAAVKQALEAHGLYTIYEQHLAKAKEADKLKREANNLKKEFARMILA